MRFDTRQSLIAKIHIAKKQLAIDDASYRAMLFNLTKQNSCANMNITQLEAVLAQLIKCGFVAQPKAKYGAKPNARKSAKAMINKVEAILADNQLHWNYAHAIAKHMFNVDKVHWLRDDQLHKLVAALQIHAKRNHGGN